jgi:hypothetical protein
VILIGTDPTFHSTFGPGGAQGGDDLTASGIAFAASDPGKTGAYITLSCYYHGTPAMTPIPLLDAFVPGGFTMTHVPGCFNPVHIVATHPSMATLTDALLSNWNCSVHEAFDSWPLSFEVMAIATTGTVYTATDGTVGTPYILARGVTVISDIDLDPDTAINPIGTMHTVTATVEEDGTPVVGVMVHFEVIAGPNTGVMGSDTTDAAGQATFTWSSAVAGVDTVQATFTDSAGRTQRSDRVTKEWIGLPPLTCDAGSDSSVNEASAFVVDGSASSGGVAPLSYAWSGGLPVTDPSAATTGGTTGVVYGDQLYVFTLTVTDSAGQSESCIVNLTVIDSDLPPDCDNAAASPALLWPPNHKMRNININGVTDVEGPPTIMVTGATQDEATASVAGAGNFAPDATLMGSSADVRAERSGLYDGRVVQLNFTATDVLGQSCSGSVNVGIPHDKKDTPIDSGQVYDATTVN